MSNLKARDGDVSERDLLVDDIQRIREVLHISGCAAKLSSDEDDEEFEEDEDEEKEQEQGRSQESLLGSSSKNLHQQLETQLAHQNWQIGIPGAVLNPFFDGQQSSLNARQINNAQGPSDVPSLHEQANNNLVPSERSSNLLADDYSITELQPVNCQPSVSALSSVSYSNALNLLTNVPLTRAPGTSLPSANLVGFCDSTSPTVDDQFYGPDDMDGVEEFSEGDEEIINNLEMHNKIQQCLSLNREYQLAILDELERIELALAKNKEQQLGLHQMRARKDEGKPEGHTLLKFGNPYFRDTGFVGPPDNDDTKMKRQTCQVDGYQMKEKIWNAKEKGCLAEGVKMQNLENKLYPVLQRIQKLELKKGKTNSDLKELEELKAESSRIKSIPKDEFAYHLEGIDWDKISSIYVPKKTGFQCRLQWCNFGHPDVNRTPWTKNEDKKLLQLAKDPQKTWVDIAQGLQTKRTPIHCYERFQRSLNKNLMKSKWTPDDDKLLLDVVRVVGVGNWARVASFLEGRTGDQCMHRYTQTLQMVRKGKWTVEEDELLKKGIQKYGTCWNKLSEMVPGRSGPQCRERWVNALDPKIDKGVWTNIQDQKLLENVEKFGKGNWSKIARAMGNRTDNQCWRRWIVLRKDDFLYYRQNTLRKRRELVANFTGRKQERPSLRAEDLDIPDVPVVKKPRGRIPLPPEESQERRRLTRLRHREKKQAEKRRAAEEARARMAEESKQREANEAREEETDGVMGDEKREEKTDGLIDDENREEDTGGVMDGDEEIQEVAKNPRNRKAGENRTRVQQPHHRVLMKNKQTKQRKVRETKRTHQTGASAGDKTIAVSGTLGPFSLLLQAFSIDIPTVLQAIQNSSTMTSSTPPSSHANVTVASKTTADQTGDATRNQEGQAGHVPATSQFSSSTHSSNSSREATDNILENQTKSDQNRKESLQNVKPDSQLLKEKRDVGDDHRLAKNPNTEETSVDLQSKAGTSDNAGTAAVMPTSATASATNQVPRRRAPAIPPLPPSFTTLRTFKALLQLRPELQRIAAMLNATPRCSTAGSHIHQPLVTACPVVSSGSHSSQESGAPRSELCNDDQTLNRSSDNGTTSGRDCVISAGRACHTRSSDTVEPSSSHVVSVRNTATDSIPPTENTQLDKQLRQKTPSDSKLVQQARTSETHSSTVQYGVDRDDRLPKTSDNNEDVEASPSGTFRETGLRSEPGGILFRSDKQTDTTINKEISKGGSNTVANQNQGTTAVSRTRAYRNSYEYKLLSSRFNSLFVWPALLSKIPVKFTSQIGPSFVQQHPPPKLSVYPKPASETRPRKRTAETPIQAPRPKRKHPGLAAVRMASTASFMTPAQQLCTLAKGSAITKETSPSAEVDTAAQPKADASNTNEVLVAASQLVSLHGTTNSSEVCAPRKRPCNTRPQHKRRTAAVRRRRVTESSSSSSEDDTFVINEGQKRLPARVTRQTTRKLGIISKESSTLSSSAKASFSTPTKPAGSDTNATPVISISSDSIDESLPKSPVLVSGVQGNATDQQPQVTDNQDKTPLRSDNLNPSPSSSSKRKNPRPVKNRGACWRAMLPKVSSDEGDSQ